MRKKSISKISDDYPEITQKEMDRAVFRVGLKEVPRKQRVSDNPGRLGAEGGPGRAVESKSSLKTNSPNRPQKG